MNFFTKKEIIYKEQTGKEAWLSAKQALADAGIEYSSGITDKESPVGGCGAKLDIRNFGPRGKIDRKLYYIEVAVKDAETAKNILKQALS